VAQNRYRVTTPGFRPTSNPEQAHWSRELGKSSAAQPHTPKPRKGTRTERERQTIQEQQKER
jgi:hypothetical protein